MNKRKLYIPTRGNTDYGTPPELVDLLAKRWAGGAFDLDPAASDRYHVTQRYFTPADNGLLLPWEGRVFLNPPYGREEEAWLVKAIQEVMAGRASVVVALLPAKTGKHWWDRYIVADVGYPGVIDLRFPVRHVWFIPGRIQFVGAKSTANFDNVVVVFERYAVVPRHRGRKSSSEQLSLLE